MGIPALASEIGWGVRFVYGQLAQLPVMAGFIDKEVAIYPNIWHFYGGYGCLVARAL